MKVLNSLRTEKEKIFLKKSLDKYETRVLKQSYLFILGLAERANKESVTFDELVDTINSIIDEYDEAGLLEEDR